MANHNCNCSKCKYKNRCGGCSNCEVLICKKKCDDCYSICLFKKNVKRYLNSFDNFNISLSKNTFVHLPTYLPVIPQKINTKINSKYLALHAGKVLTPSGRNLSRLYHSSSYLAKMNLDINSKVLLEFYVKDKFLEGFWDNRYSIYKILKDLHFTSVISPNFSLYEDSPRIEHLYNIKRNCIVYNEILDIGINAIPDISWFDYRDLELWADEINKRKINLISFSFQNVGVGLKPSNHWRHNLIGLKYLCERIHKNVNIILAGVESPFRIIEIYETIENRKFIILGHSAYINSRKGILSEIKKSAPKMSFDEIFKRNIYYYKKIYNEIYTNNKLSQLINLPKEKLIELYKNPENQNNKLTKNFIYRCLRKKRVNEVLLSQNQGETQYQINHNRQQNLQQN
jgi:hypothetical protein